MRIVKRRRNLYFLPGRIKFVNISNNQYEKTLLVHIAQRTFIFVGIYIFGCIRLQFETHHRMQIYKVLVQLLVSNWCYLGVITTGNKNPRVEFCICNI